MQAPVYSLASALKPSQASLRPTESARQEKWNVEGAVWVNGAIDLFAVALCCLPVAHLD